MTWWADIFEIPVVAFDIETAREAGELADAGADFVAATLPLDRPGEADAAWAADLIAAVRPGQIGPGKLAAEQRT